ncbi:MAG: c-type cytochrome [Methylococcales bacterium]
MKSIFLILALLAPFAVNAGPASDIAWTPETLNFVKAGFAEKGQILAKNCSGCHGEQGVSTMPETPSLAGQLATFTYKQLHDYAKGNRSNPVMEGIAKELSAQDKADLAAWFSTLPKASAKSDGQNLAKAEKMVAEGDGKRILPPCSVCHGSNGQGEKMDIPALAGQQTDYLVKALMDYKSGERHNDIYSRMRLIAQQLSDQEIKDLGQYYQQLK